MSEAENTPAAVATTAEEENTTTAAEKKSGGGGGGGEEKSSSDQPAATKTENGGASAETTTTATTGGEGGGEKGKEGEGEPAAEGGSGGGGDGSGGAAETSSSTAAAAAAAAAASTAAAPPPPEEPNEAEEMYKKLTSESPESKSLLKKHLTKNVLDKLKTKKTEKGATLADCIRSGVELPDCKVGVFAPDAESYAVFGPLLEGVVKSVHGLPEKKQIPHQPALDFGDLEKVKLDNLDPDGKYVTSVCVGAGRSLDGHVFLSLLTKENLEEVEEKAKEALKTLGDDLEGSYQSLGDVDSALLEQLLKEGNAFADSDKSVQAAGGYKEWPRGRGIFHNGDKSLVAWVNQEEHLKLLSKQNGADLAAAYGRLVKALKALGEKLTFVRDDRLGFLGFSPACVGTALRVTLNLRIPTAAQQANFQTTLDKMHLQCQAVEGEEGVFSISNRRSVGVSEVQLVTEVYNGARDLIKLEQDLTWKPETLQEMVDHVTKTKSCKSLMKKHLTKDIADRLKDKKTTMGGALADCIRSGSWNLDSGVGIYAADPEAYTMFADIFDPVIKDYHKFKASDPIAHPAADFGDLDTIELPDLDPENELIVSTRIRVGRSHKEYGFPPVLTKEDREAMEKKTVDALNGLGDDLKGTYHPLTGMTRETQDQLTKDHFLFKDDDRFLRAASGYDDWPTGRGIYFNEGKTFLVWVNEEDHLRIISMQSGGDLGAVYKRLVKAVKALEEKLTFARDDRLGYVTFCPSNLGTTLRASVHIKIPKLAARKDFKATCDKLKLQARGIHGEHTESEGGIYDISNKRRLGLTELQAVTEMYEGVKEIMKLEKDLQAGKGAKSSSCNII